MLHQFFQVTSEWFEKSSFKLNPSNNFPTNNSEDLLDEIIKCEFWILNLLLNSLKPLAANVLNTNNPLTKFFPNSNNNT